jgi:hypothetical protein
MTDTTKKVRGKGKRPALTHVNLRLPVWVIEYYKQYPSYTGKMREVLTAHALPAIPEPTQDPDN